MSSREGFRPPVEEEPAARGEYEAKKQRSRENRLRHIVERLRAVLEQEFSNEAGEFEIGFEEIDKYRNPTVDPKRMFDVPDSDRPAFHIFLRMKKSPGVKHEIMHLFRGDIDRRVRPDQVDSAYSIPYFANRIERKLRELRA